MIRKTTFESENPDSTEPNNVPNNDGAKTENKIDDPDGYKKEFDFPADEIAARGPCIGFIRIAAFQPDDGEKVGVMTDVNTSGAFTIGMINLLSTDDTLFEYMKNVVEVATMKREFDRAPIENIVESLMNVFESHQRRKFSEGGIFSPRGRGFDMDEIEQLLAGRHPRRKHPLEQILDDLNKKDSNRGKELENMFKFFDNRRDADGSPVDCNCPECLAELERMQSKPAGDNSEKQTTQD